MGAYSLRKQYISAVDRREAMVLQKLFLTHPHSVGESYFVHQRMALSVCFALFGAALAALVHALIPALCERTASRTILALHQRITARSAQ